MADNVTTEELEQILVDLVEEQGKSTVEYVEGKGFSTKTELLTAVNELQTQLTAITELDDSNDSVSLAEMVRDVKSAVSNEDGIVADFLDKIAANKKDIVDENTRATNVEAALLGKINDNKNATDSNNADIVALVKAVADNKEAAKTTVGAINDRLVTTEATVTKLNGSKDIEGSVANLVDQEKLRAITAEQANANTTDEKITAAKTELTTSTEAKVAAAESRIEEKLEEITGGEGDSLSSISDRVQSAENILNDTTNEDSELVPGLISKVTSNATTIAQNAKATATSIIDTLAAAKEYTDAHTLKASSMDKSRIITSFRKGLGLSNDAGDGDGAVA